MSKDPIFSMGNVHVEQLTVIPDPDADPYGTRLPVYATAPDPATNDPGTVIFNSTTNSVEVARNDGTYLPLSFDGASENVVLSVYDTDGEAPDVAGSIYLNNDDFPNTIRYRNGGTFMSVISANGGAVNVFSNPIINLTAGSATGQAVEYDQFLAGPFLANTSTLDAIATAHPTGANISMNGHKITGLMAGSGPGDAVEYNQMLSAPFLSNTSTLNAIATAHPTSADLSMNTHKLTGLTAGSVAGDAVEYTQFTNAIVAPQYGGTSTTAPGSPQTFPLAGTPQVMGGTYTSTPATLGINVSGSTITNISGGSLVLKITLSASIASTSGGSIATAYIAQNDSISGQSGSSISLLSPLAPNAAGYSTILTVADGDTIKPYMDTDTNGDVLTVQSCYLNVERA